MFSTSAGLENTGTSTPCNEGKTLAEKLCCAVAFLAIMPTDVLQSICFGSAGEKIVRVQQSKMTGLPG